MASIDFYAGSTAINNISGSGLGFLAGRLVSQWN